MYIKLIKNDSPIEYIKNPQYAKYQRKNRIFVSVDESEAEVVISFNRNLLHRIEDRNCEGGYSGGVVTIETTTKEEYEEWVESLPKPNNEFGLDDEFYLEIEQGVVDDIERGVIGE